MFEISRRCEKKVRRDFLGRVWESSLSYVVWMFLIYVGVKKCVEMCVMLFKMCSFVFEMVCQTDPNSCWVNKGLFALKKKSGVSVFIFSFCGTHYKKLVWFTNLYPVFIFSIKKKKKKKK